MRLYRLTDEYLRPISNMEPRYNFAPMQTGLVVKQDIHGRRQPAMMRWGLVPAWSKDPKPTYSTFNARGETIATQAAFRSAFKSRPCLVVADGFYEWKTLEPKNKQPYWIRLAGGAPFALGGLWESWRDPSGSVDGLVLETFTVVTTTPNTLMAELHNRMPVILAPEEWGSWLGAPEDRRELIRPFPAAKMECWPVGKAVGNVRNQGAALIERIAI